MIELRAGPTDHRMTLRTRSRESGCHVVRALCIVEVVLMTTDARTWGPLKFSSNMARDTCQIGVRSR